MNNVNFSNAITRRFNSLQLHVTTVSYYSTATLYHSNSFSVHNHTISFKEYTLSSPNKYSLIRTVYIRQFSLLRVNPLIHAFPRTSDHKLLVNAARNQFIHPI